MPNSATNPTFDHLLESSHRDNSYKLSSIGFGEEITQAVVIEVNFSHLICDFVIQYLKIVSYQIHSKKPYPSLINGHHSSYLLSKQ